MNIIDLHNEINSKSTNWDVNVSSRINENDTITITVPSCHYLFELSQDDQNPDIIYGGIYTNDDTHEFIENSYVYDGEGETVETVAKAIMSYIQADMIDYDDRNHDTSSTSIIMTPENIKIANYLTQLEALGKSKPDNLNVRVRITSSSAEECKNLIAHYDGTPTELVDDTYDVFDVLYLDGVDLTLINYTRKLDPSEYSDEYKESQRVARLNELSEKERNVLRLLSILAKHGLDAAEGAKLLKDLESVYTITLKPGETENA